MIRDITLGQYFPGHSVIHKLDPRTKIVLSIAYMASLFVARNAWSLALVSAFILPVVALSRVSMRLLWKSVTPILPVVVLTAVFNVFYGDGTPLVKFLGLTITPNGIALSVFMTVRVLFLVIGASMLTYTTSPIALADGIESLLGPLKKLQVPVHELSMMMTIALRFIPTLIDETDKIMSAQKARGADFETGSLMRRMKALVPILIPLFVSAFRRAGELALAMESRCYRGGEGRTRMRTLRLAPRDPLAFLVVAALIAAAVLLNLRFGSMI